MSSGLLRVRAMRFWVGGLCGFAAIGSTQAQMSLPGSFAVSPSGAATYIIPISIPAGIAGVMPKLALSYSSGSGDGYVGIDWSLGGLSSITRCPRTKLQDGVQGAVNYDTNDRYCLDGQRLLVVNGQADGSAGSEYRTEADSFAKITAAAESGATAGPGSFIVKTKDGLTMEYGKTADSRVESQGKTVVIQWALNKVIDSKGNAYTVTYTEDNATGQHYPAKISYGITAANPAPTNYVAFDYETRPDVSTSYHAGSMNRLSVRMTKIRVLPASESATPVTEYRIAYATPVSAKDPSTVNSIRQCSGSTCGPALNMTTQPAGTSFTGTNFGTAGQTGYWGGYASSPSQAFHFTGDFNGDGRTDYMDWEGGWRVFLSTGSGWNTQLWGPGSSTGYWGGYASTSSQSFHFTGDFNGDGKTDFMYWDGGWRVLLSTGSGWVDQFWGTGGKTGYWGGYASNTSQSFHFTGDFNGDGKTDFMYWDDAGWRVLLSTGSGWIAQDWGTGGGKGYWAGYTQTPSQAFHFTGDFNGDGKTDFMYLDNGGWRVLLSTGSGWNAQDWGTAGSKGYWPNYASSSNQAFHFTGDFNGDGKTDFMYWDDGGWRVLLSTGTGWVNQLWGSAGTTGYWAGYTGKSSQMFQNAVDMNGDGKTDLLFWDTATTGWRVLLSTGSGWVAETWGTGGGVGYWSSFETTTGQFFQTLGDFLGDGTTQFMYWEGGWRVLSNPAKTLVTEFKTELGVRNVVTYGNLPQLQGSRYIKSVAASGTRIPFTPGSRVVTDVDTSNGLGGQRQTQYIYANAVRDTDPAGRGYLGFQWTQTKDVATGLVSRTCYRQDHPYIGMVSQSIQGTSDASWPACGSFTSSTPNVLSLTTNTYAAKLYAGASTTATNCGDACTVAAGQRYFIYPVQSTTQSWDWDGNSTFIALPQSRTTQTYDDWGNALTIKGETLKPDGTASGYAKTTTNVYAPADTSNWILGRVVRSSVQADAP